MSILLLCSQRPKFFDLDFFNFYPPFNLLTPQNLNFLPNLRLKMHSNPKGSELYNDINLEISMSSTIMFPKTHIW